MMKNLFDQRFRGLERLDELIVLAESASRTQDTREFHNAFRASEIPYLLEIYGTDISALFRATVTALHGIGSSSPAIALGVSQHMASVFAFGIAKAVLDETSQSVKVINSLLEEVFRRRILLANTTSHAGGSKIGASGSVIKKVNGGYMVEGHSTYMSLALEAGKVVFLSRSDDGNLIGVISDLKGNPELEIDKDLLFGKHLVLADTRRLLFKSFVVGPDQVIGPDPNLNAFYLVQLICHNLCVAALYLGGAGRMLKEAIKFSRTTSLPDGRQLSVSESFQANIGKLGIGYFNSTQLILSASAQLAELQKMKALDASLAGAILSQISAIKYTVAQNVEQIATDARKLIGARAFMNDHPVGRINNEIVFGALGPATEKLIELKFGSALVNA